ncbi:MAG: ComF family protein [Patescibacteria group bacterium]|nr:ComF family protein [Patescibacteria group bacterium]
MKNKLRKAAIFLLDLLFPVTCLGCGKEGQWLCQTCLNQIKFNKKQVCPVCRKPSNQGQVCFICQKNIKLKSLVVICDYQDQIIEKAIHSLKYKYARDLKKFFNLIINFHLQNNDYNFLKNSVIIPIPLHKKREKWRGFNQALIIAKELSKITNIYLSENSLKRTKNTKSQIKLKAKQRQKNLENAFKVSQKLEILGKTAILIDDVYTTGATMNEAAKALKKAGAKDVKGLVIARNKI